MCFCFLAISYMLTQTILLPPQVAGHMLFTILSDLKTPVDETIEQQVAAAKNMQGYIRNAIYNLYFKPLSNIYEAWVNLFAEKIYDQVKNH